MPLICCTSISLRSSKSRWSPRTWFAMVPAKRVIVVLTAPPQNYTHATATELEHYPAGPGGPLGPKKLICVWQKKRDPISVIIPEGPAGPAGPGDAPFSTLPGSPRGPVCPRIPVNGSDTCPYTILSELCYTRFPSWSLWANWT